MQTRGQHKQLESAGGQLTEEAFFFFPLWPDLDLLFLALDFFFTSLALFLLFLTPGPGTQRAASSCCCSEHLSYLSSSSPNNLGPETEKTVVFQKS